MIPSVLPRLKTILNELEEGYDEIYKLCFKDPDGSLVMAEAHVDGARQSLKMLVRSLEEHDAKEEGLSSP